MDLAPLTRTRTRLIARSIGMTLVPGLAAGVATLAIAAIVDDARGLGRPWRAAALAVAAAVAIGGAEAFRRSLARRNLTLAGVARYAAARTAASRNTLVSYLELGEGHGSPAYVTSRLAVAAEREAATIDPAALAPLKPFGLSMLLLAVAAVALLVPVARGYDAIRRLGYLAQDHVVAADAAAAPPAAVIEEAPDRLSVRVVPPAYTGVAPVVLDTPSEIAAIAGSHVEMSLAPGAPGVNAAVTVNGAEPIAMKQTVGNALSFDFVASEEGSVAVQVSAASGERPRLVLPLRIQPDRPPDVHITQPAADVLVDPRDRPRTLSVAFEASDDFGLGSARLVYIRSIGEGDSTEFVDGSVPVAVSANGRGAARGQAVLDLDKLGVVAGATLVFHVEVQDRNAVSGPATGMSESLVFEVAAPPPPAPITIGELKPEQLARFLVSQRMILEHTLALEAKRASMPRTEFLARSSDIAAEQRTFKESFDQFVEIRDVDEREHSEIAAFKSSKEYDKATEEASKEAATDKNDKTASAEQAHERTVEERTEAHAHGAPDTNAMSDPARELLLAIRAMWDAERSLGIGETDVAIPSEREAIDHLKKAQRAVRYFPRVKVQTKPLDLKRRYAGELADIRSRLEALARQPVAPEENGLREALTEIYGMCRDAAALDAETSPPGRASDLGVRAQATSGELLGLKTGYDPSVVAVAGKLENAAAAARLLNAARSSGDTGRARSALTTLNNECFAAASQLGALLDRRRYVHGSSTPEPGGAADRLRSAEYSRRLAGARP